MWDDSAAAAFAFDPSHQRNPQEWSDDERAEVEGAVIAAAALYATLQPLSMSELRDRLMPCNRPGASLDMAAWRERA
ncbi:hypothetical protein CHELA40_14735 [Chelatococcus asaccharovorans]|nr:hypothetical protein CHELA17_60885 [Chelatococcus asaccharovorans]CAH1679610.1 hypothetical protein CHELA40_14735 [Chelatococcus asaccharovorans]